MDLAFTTRERDGRSVRRTHNVTLAMRSHRFDLCLVWRVVYLQLSFFAIIALASALAVAAHHQPHWQKCAAPFLPAVRSHSTVALTKPRLIHFLARSSRGGSLPLSNDVRIPSLASRLPPQLGRSRARRACGRYRWRVRRARTPTTRCEYSSTPVNRSADPGPQHQHCQALRVDDDELSRHTRTTK